MTLSGKCYNPSSLKNVSNRILKRYLSCHNVLDVLIFSHALKLGKLCEKAKEFIWTNKSNVVLKSNWKNLEISNPNLFENTIKIMMEALNCNITSKYDFGPQIFKTVYFAIGKVSLEDVFVVIIRWPNDG